MAGVAHVKGLGHHVPPGHFREVVAKRHRVGDNFQAVFQGAVVLDVDVFPPLEPGGLHQPLGVAVGLPCPVDLQLHAEVSRSLSIEDGVGLVVVIVDFIAAAPRDIAAMAQRFLLVHIVTEIICLLQFQQHPAAGAVGVAAVIAALTQRRVLVPRVVLPQDMPSTGMAKQGFLLQAGAAELLAVHHRPILQRVELAAGAADKGFCHQSVSSSKT